MKGSFVQFTNEVEHNENYKRKINKKKVSTSHSDNKLHSTYKQLNDVKTPQTENTPKRTVKKMKERRKEKLVKIKINAKLQTQNIFDKSIFQNEIFAINFQ